MVGYAELMDAARHPGDPATLAFAGVIALAAQRRAPYDVPIAGLDGTELAALKESIFPGLKTPLLFAARRETEQSRYDEFGDLVELLLEHRTWSGDKPYWLAHAIATAAMAENHLWQDLGLRNRGELSWLMRAHFTTLEMRNTSDMKWKKFFYRQLCERSGISVCRSPSCGICSDYSHCFGAEDGAAAMSS
ncbi:nitrogen fixation protein NifQ [Herbaspirillum sp. HC18]|nr:nitrogen fixation protein NifQ [Herbaspirillum sp. HC18]